MPEMARSTPAGGLIIHSDFSGYGSFPKKHAAENERGKQDRKNWNSGGKRSRYPVCESAQRVYTKLDAGADRAVVARTVMFRLYGDIKAGKQHDNKHHHTDDACQSFSDM
ncbi:MAG: hypothetical protein K5911_02435 [Eubacteriales bacterium]|nr:hypothetical protein [Eubacteriales bacterium]